MKAITDKQMEISIGRMLRVGVTISASIVFLGGLLYLRKPWGAAPDYSHFVAERESLPGIVGVLQGVKRLHRLVQTSNCPLKIVSLQQTHAPFKAFWFHSRTSQTGFPPFPRFCSSKLRVRIEIASEVYCGLRSLKIIALPCT
jgi:hypothetical protein